MRITESRLRKIIRSVIRESEHIGYGEPGSALNNPLARSSISASRSNRERNADVEREAHEHYTIFGCEQPPEDPDVRMAWERICEENGDIV